MTDGCSAQYKSKIPFSDISCSILDNGFPIERHFYGSRHGKGPSDGAGAVVKSFIRRGVMGNNVIINNAEDFYEYAKELTKDDTHSKRSLFFVKDINRDRPERSNKKTLVGTRKLQCVKTIQKDHIATRNLSCFCKPCLTEVEVCENSAYVDKWTTHMLKTIGARTRVVGGINGIQPRARGHCAAVNEVRQRRLKGGARTRGGVVQRGEARSSRKRIGVRTRGRVCAQHGTARIARTQVRVRTRGGSGNARYRQESSSDDEESFDSDSSSDQAEIFDPDSTSDKKERYDSSSSFDKRECSNHCSSSYEGKTSEQIYSTEKIETDVEEFSDIVDISDVSGVNTILDFLQFDQVHLQVIVVFSSCKLSSAYFRK